MRDLTDREVVALTLWGEARGEDVVGRIAVASVLRNRVADGRWGKTYQAVCWARLQFSCWNANDPNLPKLQALTGTLAAGAVTDRDLLGCLWLADGLVDGRFASTVRDATHYFAAAMPAPPAWAATGTQVARVGGHLFYRGVR